SVDTVNRRRGDAGRRGDRRRDDRPRRVLLASRATSRPEGPSPGEAPRSPRGWDDGRKDRDDPLPAVAGRALERRGRPARRSRRDTGDRRFRGALAETPRTGPRSGTTGRHRPTGQATGRRLRVRTRARPRAPRRPGRRPLAWPGPPPGRSGDLPRPRPVA